MDLNEDDVIQIIKYLDESSFSEIRLEIGGLKIVVNKRGSEAFIDNAHPPDELIRDLTDRPATIDVEDWSTSPPLPASPDTPEAPPNTGEETIEDGSVSITSPMLGTFYKAPKPGDPPFVEVGTVVDEDTTVCIIEVMKLFSTIKAGKVGRITRIFAEDGQLVEYRQILFMLDPNG